MNVLCIDTSGAFLNIAICREGKVLAGLARIFELGHSEVLRGEVEGLLDKSSVPLAAIGLIAAITGPGSFTGLRVGISFAKGLAAGLAVPVVSLDTLDVMAASQDITARYLSPMIDARKREVYTCLYESVNGSLMRQTEPVSISPDKWLNQLPEGSLLFGSGEECYHRLILEKSKSFICDESFLASGKILSGMAAQSNRAYIEGLMVPQQMLDAFYLRPADAVISHHKII